MPEAIHSAFSTVFTGPILIYTFAGVILGMFIGAMPGLSATMGVAILLPITFWLEPRAGLGMLFGIYNSAIYAGGISAVLLGIPGTPASIASTFDGPAISKRGQPTLALWINTVYSASGGIFGIIILMAASFPIARCALRFGAPEYAMTALFGLSMIVAVSGKNISKGLMIGFFGLGLAMVGMDSMQGVKRYTFGLPILLDGFSFVPIMIGLFGIGEALKQLSESPIPNYKKVDKKSTQSDFIKETPEVKKRLTIKEMFAYKWAFFLTAIISVFIGAVPGTGGDIASLVSWTQCRNFSKEREKYGNGSEEALAVTCTANNASIGGAMTTMLSLGIPGDSVTAILIGALMMYNYTPGPLLFRDHADMVYVIFLLLIICNAMILFLGNLSSRIFAKFTKLPRAWISTTIVLFSFVGSYAIQNSTFDVFVCFAAGLLGFTLAKAGISSGPLVLALILGDMLESNFVRSMMLPPGTYATFFVRPISFILIILIILSLFGRNIIDTILNSLKRNRR